MTIDFYSDEAEVVDRKQEKISPSGRFKLVIRYYQTSKITGQSTWNYSRGTVYRISDNTQIVDIKRNYCQFHHSFVTKNNQEYIITGRSYMGQTIANLDTGEEWNKEDGAFCWAAVTISPDQNTLVVDGCFWACPYECRLFDFSNPSQGWPELKHDYIDADDKSPVWINDTTLEVYKTSDFYKPLQCREDDIERGVVIDYKNKDNWERILDSTTQYQRQGNSVVFLNEVISEFEKEDRRKQKEYEAAEKVYVENFKSNDVFYKQIRELNTKFNLNPSSTGWMYNPSRNFVFYYSCKDNRSIELVYNLLEPENKPFIVSFYDDHKKISIEYPKTVEGLTSAIEYIKSRS